MLEETHVAATPGVDFDPLHGKQFIRFCYAGSAARDARGGRADRDVAQALTRLPVVQRSAAAMLPPSTVVTSPVVLSSQRLVQERLRHVVGGDLAAEQIAAEVVLLAHAARLASARR